MFAISIKEGLSKQLHILTTVKWTKSRMLYRQNL